MSIHVHLLPKLVDPALLRGGIAVVIDTLRATTTIAHALAAGATTIIPCGEIEQAQAIAATTLAGNALLGGERHGMSIPGFDLDNSPLKYTPDILTGKTLVFTTTNGTRALSVCLEASRILVGAFVNRQATIDALTADGRPVHLVCAGTDGYITAEDVLFAGSVAKALYQTSTRSGTSWHDAADDETQLAVALWDTIGHRPDAILQVLRNSRGGRNLIDLGFDADIVRSAECDRFNFAAEFYAAQNEIRIARR